LPSGDHESAYACTSPPANRQIAAAESLQQVDPTAAASAWARLDRRVTDLGFLLPTVTFKEVDVVDRRVDNDPYHLLSGPLVDQMWVR
jgi:hypothetical protein